jgi:contractile injection system tube protein
VTNLVKAQLCELEGNESGREVPGTQVDVQFNPTSLRVSINNRTAGGQQAGSQARQRPGTGEIQVSFDLVFDTADEGTTDAPVPVTRKTQMVEKFVRPRGSSPAQQTPPRVQFRWGSFLVQGVMESANSDLDLFAADGTPLRAKVSVSIKGQDPSYRYQPSSGAPPAAAAASPSGGAGAGSFAAPGPLDPPPGAPGTQGGAGAPAKVAQAMPGESLQQLAARNGLDPAAWRALASGIGNPLALAAGAEVALPDSLRLAGGASGGLGTTDPAAATAKLPLVAPGALPRASSAAPAGAAVPQAARADPVRAGQAVARQGGVTGAIAQVRESAKRDAVAASLNAFGLSPRATTPTALARPYGDRVPLRPWRGAGAERPPTTLDPTVPPWEALPGRIGSGARALDRARPVDACECDCGAVRLRGGRGG